MQVAEVGEFFRLVRNGWSSSVDEVPGCASSVDTPVIPAAGSATAVIQEVVPRISDGMPAGSLLISTPWRWIG